MFWPVLGGLEPDNVCHLLQMKHGTMAECVLMVYECVCESGKKKDKIEILNPSAQTLTHSQR